jgi:ferrous iron transport protein B
MRSEALESHQSDSNRDPLRSGDRVRRLFLVGNPNVGKSVLFNALTGTYATVSNYPGTTVEVSRGTWKDAEGFEWEVVDTPGMYSLRSITDEERVARDILLREKGLIVHVVDAKNLPRMLTLTLELALLGRPIFLVLNLMDEAEIAGVALDRGELEAALAIPVVETVATRRQGLDALRERLSHPPPAPPHLPELPLHPAAAQAWSTLTRAISSPDGAFWALRHLAGDPSASQAAPVGEEILGLAVASLGDGGREAFPAEEARALKVLARAVAARVFRQEVSAVRRFSERLDTLLMNPWTGFPVLAAVLYFGLYQFVGVLGGGVFVGFLEGTVFGEWVNPFLNGFFAQYVPWPWIHGLFVGDYGVLTLGLRYAVAIIMPIVGTFFLAFSVLEDTGYLPRLAMLLDGIFKRVGLNGRAVIPLVLGFGCDTMATIVTRILETRRERIIATFLLALAVPCSAQLGLILGLLGGHRAAFILWVLVLTGVFLLSGTLMARLLPGQKPQFFMEMPPLRLPSWKNVWSKTVSRMGWYFMEVIPLFAAASALIWIGQVTGLFGRAVALVRPMVVSLGLPGEAATAFLFGFFRRDYGAAGLYDLAKAGSLSGVQLLVATVTLTLFLPCVAQFLMMKKERGWGVTLSMSAAILAVAFSVGWTLNALLTGLGVSL